jgi:hypothetical protein
MKHLFSSPSAPEVELLKSQLDQAGIAAEIRGEVSYSNFPGAAFQPELWVVQDEDFAEACNLRDSWLMPGSSRESRGPVAIVSPRRSDLIFCVLATILSVSMSVLLLLRYARTDNVRNLAGAAILGLASTAGVFITVGLWRSRRNVDSR